MKNVQEEDVEQRERRITNELTSDSDLKVHSPQIELKLLIRTIHQS